MCVCVCVHVCPYTNVAPIFPGLPLAHLQVVLSSLSQWGQGTNILVVRDPWALQGLSPHPLTFPFSKDFRQPVTGDLAAPYPSPKLGFQLASAQTGQGHRGGG